MMEDKNMAKYKGVFACGHEGTIYRDGGGKESRVKAAWIMENNDCPACEEARRQAKIKEENEKAVEITKELNLPELQGSEKQISWASTLRIKALGYLDELITKCNTVEEISRYENRDLWMISESARKSKASEIADVLLNTKRYIAENELEASFWIDTRGLSIGELKGIIEKSREGVENMNAPNEAIEEATLLPENVYYPGVVRIKREDDTIIVQYLKNDDFRAIIKSLGFKWNGGWERKLTEKTGEYADRAAELVNKLLSSGFSVQIFDSKVREKAIAGDYEPEHKRWIQRYSDTELAFDFEYGDADVYKNAIKIPGAKYKRPLVVADASVIKEVEEFAENYGFKFTKRAEVIRAEYSKIWKEKQGVTVKEVEVQEVKDGLKETLKKTGAVIEDLVDED